LLFVGNEWMSFLEFVMALSDRLELSESYRLIKDQTGSNTVDFCEQRYSERPIASWGYSNCNGVVFLGFPSEPDIDAPDSKNGVVVTHYGNTEDQNPLTDKEIFSYLNRALSRIRGSGIEGVIAGVIAGDTRHYDLIMTFLDKNNVYVKGAYCDRSPDVKDTEGHRYRKDLVVSPELERAIVSIESMSFLDLL